MEKDNIEDRGNFFQKLITNLFILRPPDFNSSNYKSLPNYKDKLIFIERNDHNYIPCIFYRCKESSNFLIYFHGNSEHIFNIDNYGLEFRSYLKMNVILVEYPGYSIYENVVTDPNSIFLDSLTVFDWVTKTFQITEKQIFICGRSLGTSPAIYLSSEKNPQALFLISPFTSIKNIGKDFCASIFIEKIFKSCQYAKNLKCPVLIIHGKKDPLINFNHSIELKEEINNNGFSKIVELKLRDNMTHNDFDIKDDIIYLIRNFINSNKLNSNQKTLISLDEEKLKELYHMPLPITILIESKIFSNINEFRIKKKIPKEKADFLIRLNDTDIALTNGTKISIFNNRNLNLEQDILLETSDKSMEITSLFQMKNENLICGTNLGDIFIFEKDYEFEEFKEIQHLTLEQEEIYKIDKFFPNFIFLLTNKTIQIHDDINFNVILSINLSKTYVDLVQISNIEVVMLSQNSLYFNKIQNKKIEELHKTEKLAINGEKRIMITTNQYLLIGGIKCIYYWDIIKMDYKLQKTNFPGIINYFHKIHDKLFLAATFDGDIFQIVFDKNNRLDIISKISTNNDIIINSLLLKNYKTILCSVKDGIQVWSSAKQKDNDDNCNIM